MTVLLWGDFYLTVKNVMRISDLNCFYINSEFKTPL